MDSAIAWLVQTILATLKIDKLDAWIGEVGLADDIQKLKSEIRRVKMVVSTMKERGIGNEPLSESLALLQDHLYEADDVVDELDYYRLQQQVQGVDDPQAVLAAEQADDTTRSRGSADMPFDGTSSSRGVKKRKKRSKAWDNYNVTEEDEHGNAVRAACKLCKTTIKCTVQGGTSGMRNHNKSCKKIPAANYQQPNPSSAGDATEPATPTVIADSSGRKRRREDEESAQITVASTYIPWEKTELSNKIQKLTSQLQNAREELSEVLKLHGPDSASSSKHHSSTASDQRPRTSSLLSRMLYGRVTEKISIKNLILEDKSDGVRVLPIVGIAGVGKTALAQFVYNDPEVESKFDHRIWVWVSRNFDEVRLTREMLDFVSQERHEGISSFAKLQEILKNHANSKRLLIIFDDVWDDMKDCQWHKLLAPFISGQGTGIAVLVTARSLSVAKRLGTLKPVKLGALEHDDILLLLKSCAFGDGNYEGPSKLSTIGLKIAKKLKGNPLAAVSVAALLKENLTVDHWSNILEKEDWKSLGLSEGIMPALKLSYDQLPYHLQQCFSYCSIFPNKHKFLGKDLVCIWISQGFVDRTCLNKRLEETGWEYLTDLVNLGFFQQVEEENEEEVDKEEEEESSLGSQNWYFICGLIHDLLRIVSRNYCATIDGLQCTKMLPTIQHLSVVTDSAYSEDWLGHIPRNNKFEEKLRNTVISVRKLRTLVLIGKHDSHFFQVFLDKFRIAHNLRLLQMSATSADFNSLVYSLVDPTHLRYVKLKSDGLHGTLPLVLMKFFHLQVLDVCSNIHLQVPDGMHNLVSLRHLVAEKGVYSSIAKIGNMTSLKELHDFKVQFRSAGFEISQLQSMNELVELGVSQLDYVESREEAYGAGLRDKVHLEKLCLSWMNTLSYEEYSSDSSSESSEELLPMDDGGPSSEPSVDTAREVLEGLEPHMDLKHLTISWYIGTTSPTWLASNISVTSLQTLHLDGCGRWRILPSLESLPFLRKLNLSRMREVTEVLVPSLEELVLIKMRRLMRCSSNCVEGLNSSLRALQIEDCQVLKEFDLLENNDGFEIEQRSWLPGLRKLILLDCPRLEVLTPLPPSTTVCALRISGVSILPCMNGSSIEMLRIGYFGTEEGRYGKIDASSHELRILDDKILAFHNLRNLKSMIIVDYQNLSSFSFEGFSHLICLKTLQISYCRRLLCSDVMLDASLEYATTANWKAFPCLESLSMQSCAIAGKWLSLLLRHAPDLEELHLEQMLSIEDELVHIPVNLISSLKKITIKWYPHLTFNGNEEGFSGFTSLEELIIWECPRVLSSLMLINDGNDNRANGRWLLPKSLGISGCSQETLQPCFPRNLTSLKKLEVWTDPGLESLQLHACTALENLTIWNCESLITLEGLQSLGSLRHLAVSMCPRLRQCLERFSRQGYELCSRLEMLEIDDPSVLTTSLCFGLTSLRRLQLQRVVLTEEQGRALVLLKSLQDLEFYRCYDLVDLPAGLHLLPSLQRLKLRACGRLSRLPETGLPLSLEELEIVSCSKELADQWRLLAATSKLRINIDEDWLVS